MLPSNFFRQTISVLLIPLLMAQLLLPFTGNVQRSAFVNWLDQNLVDVPESSWMFGNTFGAVHGSDLQSTLRLKIRALSHEARDLPSLIFEASLLVSEHNDQFRFEFPKGPGSDSSSQDILFRQWNWFSHQKNSVKGVMPELFKPLGIWMPAWNGCNRTALDGDPFGRTISHLLSATDLFADVLWVRPFLSGMSIHAP